ncbi:MAG TPA: cytochrome c biogenesis protein CcdA [Methanotrichaceae archaeon]|nr:cytochrome c biogenesis protein CcdA [Methanotrichaceae archaeon]HQI91111.1 cytochrome c biogenesis protein CcdA [Methanotrichaceae archaeon]HQJ28498.1 cytochrome c biogenesis protein CcdA [Methanotrichaceae archaeon]
MSTMSSWTGVIAAWLLLSCALCSGAAEENHPGNLSQVFLVVSPGCPKCALAEKTVEEVLRDYPGVQVVEHNIYSDEGREFINEHRIKQVPSVVVGDAVIGEKDYGGKKDRLEAMLRAALAGHAIQVQQEDNDYISASEAALRNLSLATMATVLGGGLLAGFNPCLLAILAFLASTVLSASGRRRDLIYLVVCFSAGIFTVYYLFGIGLFSLLQEKPSTATGMRAFLALLLLVLGALQLEDGRRLHMGQSSLFRTDWALDFFQQSMQNRRLGSYFLAGAVFSLVKVPCVGAVYFALLGVISSEGYTASTLTYLLLYNLGVVLPVLVVGGLMALGSSPSSVDRFRQDHRVAIRLITGLTLVLLAPMIYWQIL